jgi:hypothetical protein
MPHRWFLGVQETSRPKSLLFPSYILRNIPIRLTVAQGRGRRFLLIRLLVIGAACLAAVLVTGIVLEAFDSDLDLWPFGAEDFIVASPDAPVMGGQPAGSLAALNVVQGFVISAGTHLVLQHRARNALATDRPSFFSSYSMAEPREPHLDASLALGHFIYTRPGDNQSVVDRARRAPLGPLSRAFRLASRCSS